MMNRRLVALLAPAAMLLMGSAAYAQPPVSIDVKTKWSEKPALAAAKNGAELMLLESDWAKVVELGEDYTIWLRNLGRRRVGDSVKVTIGVELRTPSMFEEGDLIGRRVVAVTYADNDDWARHGTPETVAVVREIEKYADLAVLVARAVKPGQMFLIEKSWSMLQSVMPDEFLHVRLEAMIAGLKVAAAARDLVEEAGRASAPRTPTPVQTRSTAPSKAPAGSASGRQDSSASRTAPPVDARASRATPSRKDTSDRVASSIPVMGAPAASAASASSAPTSSAPVPTASSAPAQIPTQAAPAQSTGATVSDAPAATVSTTTAVPGGE